MGHALVSSNLEPGETWLLGSDLTDLTRYRSKPGCSVRESRHEPA